jgi:hypothetical protein
MDEAEARQMRREILDDVGALLRDFFAADEWARALVTTMRGRHGEWMVASIDVEGIVGDEARVDAAFGNAAVRQALPAIAKATEALAALDGVDLDQLGGGTFLRRSDGRFAFLPGLVRTPSARFDQRRDDLVRDLGAKNEELRRRFGIGDDARFDADLVLGTITIRRGDQPVARAKVRVIGSWSEDARTWAWAGANPNLPPEARAAAAALTDAILERDIWEISTPHFTTDEGTAWALAALVCDHAGAAGVHRAPHAEGTVLLLLSDVEATS